MITKFGNFINEGLRDKMTGVSPEEQEKRLESADLINKMKLIYKYKLNKRKYLPSIEEVEEYLTNNIDKVNDWLDLSLRYKFHKRFIPSPKLVKQFLRKSSIKPTQWYGYIRYYKLDEDKYGPSKTDLKRMNSVPIKDKHGNYRWLFYWENGGGNSVWAKDKKTARRMALEMSYPSWMPKNQYANKTLKDIKKELGIVAYRYCKSQYPGVDDNETGWNSGLKVNLDSLQKATVGSSKEFDDAMDSLAR